MRQPLPHIQPGLDALGERVLDKPLEGVPKYFVISYMDADGGEPTNLSYSGEATHRPPWEPSCT